MSLKRHLLNANPSLQGEPWGCLSMVTTGLKPGDDLVLICYMYTSHDNTIKRIYCSEGMEDTSKARASEKFNGEDVTDWFESNKKRSVDLTNDMLAKSFDLCQVVFGINVHRFLRPFLCSKFPRVEVSKLFDISIHASFEDSGRPIPDGKTSWGSLTDSMQKALSPNRGFSLLDLSIRNGAGDKTGTGLEKAETLRKICWQEWI